MRRVTWIMTIVICLAVVLSGCGQKSAGAVVKDLNEKMSGLESYQGTGRMVVQSGAQPQMYNVEVWYQTPSMYRIALTNQERDITQIVLRNNEGVYVLTPQLNKSFRFQSNWPENQGQVYLYQSLVKSIVDDQERQFATDDKSYIFDVAANYSTGTLTRQKVWIDKKFLQPQKVEVADSNENVVVKLEFTQFEFNKKFENDSFDMKRNMTSENLKSMQTMGQNGEKKPEQNKELSLIEPGYTPAGVAQKSITPTQYGEDKGLLVSYQGKYNYNLLETKPQEKAAATTMQGEVVDLGFTMGVLLGDEKRTLTWMYNGVEYHLTTGDLPVTEMVKVAKSVDAPLSK
ncbi:outer membrane lipoprotein carrier protein LolA [Paenibacillus sp. N1-5-1-14]|uniref:LolA family protein n=1 Tax=Paenibacillus radicibacter TaxID=2972488 RepID=UPI0021595307|nr:outer membrane lipoprotein carrier protein LolA [Paenibacillus radicibacter]MCR8643619.1 outer membrane lipoprotein carrier protein LolA [Paenibacillus radicibacter]